MVDTFWIEEPYNKQYPVEATFEDAFESVKVRRKSGKWVAGENPDCPSINPDDCRIFYCKEAPAIFREVPVKRLVTKATSSTKQKGGKYKLVKREVMVTPARTETTNVPEVKQTVERRVLVKDETTKFEIVGSYRRGKKESGDIDVIVTSDTREVFKNFVSKLILDGVIIEVLSRGPSKSLVIGRLNDKSIPRRIDFLYSPPEEYAFATLYFTGSKMFNTVMRSHALTMSLSLNEHGLYKKEKGQVYKNSKGD